MDACSCGLAVSVRTARCSCCSIHGFSSDGRHKVVYQRFKELCDLWMIDRIKALPAVLTRLHARRAGRA